MHVTDLGDQTGGTPLLSATEYASGRARALFPSDSGRFQAGGEWPRRTPVAYRVRFDESRRPAPGLTWVEGDRTLAGTRVPLVEREVTVRNGAIVLAGTLVLPPGRVGPGPTSGDARSPDAGGRWSVVGGSAPSCPAGRHAPTSPLQ